MTTCPKCHHVRATDTTAPAWQCPACGVAYAKAAESLQRPVSERPVIFQARSESRFAWAKWFMLAAIAYGGWTGYQYSLRHRSGDASGAFGSIAASLRGGMSESDLRVLAATVKPGDVTLYTTTDCPYCAQAKGWLNQYRFAYTECNAETRSDCAADLRSHGAMGVPFLLVRGRPMHNGFDSDEFVALLRQ